MAETITFEAAIALTQSLLDRIATGEMAEADIEQAVSDLVQTDNGARGFFVTYLSDTRPNGDRPSDALINALLTAPDTVAELLVKNLAMSSAMALTHRRHQNEDMARGSDQVRSRTTLLIQMLLPANRLPLLRPKLNALLESSRTGAGEYATFLRRWGYDEEQKSVIQNAVKTALDDAL
jgi:hypothetical protein